MQVIFIAFALLATGQALPSFNLHVPFDVDEALAFYAKGNPYNFRHKGHGKPPYEPAPIKEGLIMDGTFQVEAEKTHVIKDCWSDLEECKNGFTLAIWFKPTAPWQSGSNEEYVVSMGTGVDRHFGLKLALRRQVLMPMALGRTHDIKYTCPLPDDHQAGSWIHVAVKRNTVDGPLITFLNGIKLECTVTGGDVVEHEPTQDTVDNIFVGSSSQYSHRFNGTVDELQFFHKSLLISEIRELYDAGKDRAAVLNAGGNPDAE